MVYAIPFTYIQHLHVKHQIDTSKHLDTSRSFALDKGHSSIDDQSSINQIARPFGVYYNHYVGLSVRPFSVCENANNS